jgi:hypothetical protein
MVLHQYKVFSKDKDRKSYLTPSLHYNSPAAITTPCDSRTSSDDQKKTPFSESFSLRSQNGSSKSGTTSKTTLSPPSPSYMSKRKDPWNSPYEYGKEKKKPTTCLKEIKDLKLNHHPLKKLAKSDPLE